MTREETIQTLTELNEEINSMTEEELYNHMYTTSPSFRKVVEEIDND